ncbi:hypothetical protein [Spiroplasma endosymbiont of Melieria omissa]|uniref:hypothetical protein n=1 Tax=Spiroplasma endosymbiont of Melieria omissa TaxID=3139324 RepID=UPI003CCAEBBE
MPEVSQVIIDELFGTFILILLENYVVANVLLKKQREKIAVGLLFVLDEDLLLLLLQC